MENVTKLNSVGKSGILLECYGQGVDFGKIF